MDLNKLDPRAREIWEKVQANKRKREGCSLHNFIQKEGSPFRFVCTQCGCEEDGSFVYAYHQGLEHGRRSK